MKVINWIFVLKETIILAKKQFIKLIFKNIIRKTQLRSNFKGNKNFYNVNAQRKKFSSPLPVIGCSSNSARSALWIVNKMAGAEGRVSNISSVVFVAGFVVIKS